MFLQIIIFDQEYPLVTERVVNNVCAPKPPSLKDGVSASVSLQQTPCVHYPPNIVSPQSRKYKENGEFFKILLRLVRSHKWSVPPVFLSTTIASIGNRSTSKIILHVSIQKN